MMHERNLPLTAAWLSDVITKVQKTYLVRRSGAHDERLCLMM